MFDVGIFKVNIYLQCMGFFSFPLGGSLIKIKAVILLIRQADFTAEIQLTVICFLIFSCGVV